jgi:hypothetical protein
MSFLAPKGQRLKAQGLPLRLPWEPKQESFNRNAVASFGTTTDGRNRVALVRLRIAFLINSPRANECYRERLSPFVMGADNS